MNTPSSDRILLSKRGMKDLRKKIAALEQEQREALQALRELDKGTSREERLAHIEHLARLEVIEADLEDKKHTLSKAVLLPSKRERLKVALGSVVDLIDQQGQLFRYTIVESVEADPSDGRISAASPLGSSLLGKTLQETIELSTGRSQRSLQLISIR